MDMTEVTLGQFQEFRKALKSERGRNVIPDPLNASADARYPVLGVTLLQAQFYARRAGKDLPTEAEWERAARGESAFEHPWGNGRAIWKIDRTPGQIGAVKNFPTDRSPFGIYDLAGNAREWCLDRYSPTAFADAQKAAPAQLRNWKQTKQAGNAQADPIHVVKGNGPHWEAWHRAGVKGTERVRDVGFRCVLRLSGKDE
jgi:formylglycine-generating enzyme required for sulfatase activity